MRKPIMFASSGSMISTSILLPDIKNGATLYISLTVRKSFDQNPVTLLAITCSLILSF